MTTIAQPLAVARRLGARVWGSVLVAWAVVSGVAPHVLHHVGPLAGAALLAGFGGRAIFFALGLILSIPMLRRLRRRFETLVAPLLAIVAFAAVFSFSSLVIAPLVTGSENPPTPVTGQPLSPGHASHHARGR
jgi:hypothetical protein